jgi:predicted secreted hydrolase
MALKANGPLVFQGDKGFSVKSAQGQASYYYSQPFFQIDGTLELPAGKVSVTGTAWLDREWSSQPLSDQQSGWDWFSLSFADGSKLMGFQLRQTDESRYTSSTWIEADGTTTPYGDGSFTATPLVETQVAGRDIPTDWRVRLPERDVDVTVSALNPNAWMGLSIPYWEGPVSVSGSHTGQGYLEMTGYE